MGEIKDCLEKLLLNNNLQEYFTRGGKPFLLIESYEHGGYCDIDFLILDKNGIRFERWDYHRITRHPALKDLSYEPQESKYLTPKGVEKYLNGEERKELKEKVTRILKNFEKVSKLKISDD